MLKVTFISTLEPCFQCSGKLKMSGVREVIFIQKDPLIEKITEKGKTHHFIQSPKLLGAFGRPMIAISAADAHFRFRWGIDLDRDYYGWIRSSSSTERRFSKSVPTYLCSDEARDIYRQAHLDFEKRNCLKDEMKIFSKNGRGTQQK